MANYTSADSEYIISINNGLFSKAVVKAILETKIHFISENLKLFVKSNSVNV